MWRPHTSMLKAARVVCLLASLFACGQVPPPSPPETSKATPPPPVYGKTRCAQYIQDVREQHFKYFDLNYPYWYGVGQLQQESACRANIVAFDGGKGLAQFMPATERHVEATLGPLDMMNPRDALRAQAFYMAQLHRQNWDGRLWLTYCFYNSGPGQMRAEYKRAGVVDWQKMRSVCKRKILQLKTGPLDLCTVGYDYPRRVHSHAATYRNGEDRIRYW